MDGLTDGHLAYTPQKFGLQPTHLHKAIAVGTPTHLFVHSERRRYRSNSLRISYTQFYPPEIWWNDAQYHKADRYLKWSFSAIFAHSMELWSLPWYAWASSEGRRSSAMKQVTV